MVLPLLILIGLLVIAYVVYIAVIYWYITIPIIGFIIFCLKADTIGKWIGKKRYKRHLAAQIKKREKQAKIILEQMRHNYAQLSQIRTGLVKIPWSRQGGLGTASTAFQRSMLTHKSQASPEVWDRIPFVSFLSGSVC